MEKVVWIGTFAEAEERDNEFWASKTEQERFAAMLNMNELIYGQGERKMVKVAIKRRLGEEEK